MEKHFDVIKTSGERARFSVEKLRRSLERSGADKKSIDQIIDVVRDELYQGISTREIYNRAFAMLRESKPIVASKYKLKKAIYELGPTGFPFERFISAMLAYSGFDTIVGQVMQGKCVAHEIDVVARKDGRHIMAECKFHGDEGIKCNVKIPLYIRSRYSDIIDYFEGMNDIATKPNEGWVVTNTRFTKDALDYGSCSGLYLLSWDYPEGNSLRERIDRLGLYPVTVSTLLSQREKQFLLSRDVVLCRELINDTFYLDHLEISPKRKSRILKEINQLCTT